MTKAKALAFVLAMSLAFCSVAFCSLIFPPASAQSCDLALIEGALGGLLGGMSTTGTSTSSTSTTYPAVAVADGVLGKACGLLQGLGPVEAVSCACRAASSVLGQAGNVNSIASDATMLLHACGINPSSPVSCPP